MLNRLQYLISVKKLLLDWCEASAAFSFITGTIILKNPIYLIINLIFGIVVSLCRIAMGGHFLSDNIFAMIFMIYLAILYKYFVFLYLKKCLKF